jgi:hypothetical protein
MSDITEKKVVEITCLDDLDGLTGSPDLQLNIDFSEEIEGNKEYFEEANDRIKFTKVEDKTIDYKKIPLVNPDGYIAYDRDGKTGKLCALISRGTNIVFGLSEENNFNTLCCLELMAFLPRYPDSHSEAYAIDYEEDYDLSRDLEPKTLGVPCLIGYILNGDDTELQWSLRWAPRISELIACGEETASPDITTPINVPNITAAPASEVSEASSSYPPEGSCAYEALDSPESSFILTQHDIKLFNKKRDNIILLEKRGASFVYAFALQYISEDAGKIIVAPMHCRDEIVAQVLKNPSDEQVSVHVPVETAEANITADQHTVSSQFVLELKAFPKTVKSQALISVNSEDKNVTILKLLRFLAFYIGDQHGGLAWNDSSIRTVDENISCPWDQLYKDENNKMIAGIGTFLLKTLHEIFGNEYDVLEREQGKNRLMIDDMCYEQLKNIELKSCENILSVLAEDTAAMNHNDYIEEIVDKMENI